MNSQGKSQSISFLFFWAAEIQSPDFYKQTQRSQQEELPFEIIFHLWQHWIISSMTLHSRVNNRIQSKLPTLLISWRASFSEYQGPSSHKKGA